MEEQYLKDQFEKYLFGAYCNGDIFFEYYRPYTFQEWVEEGCPEDGGIKIK